MKVNILGEFSGYNSKNKSHSKFKMYLVYTGHMVLDKDKKRERQRHIEVYR